MTNDMLLSGMKQQLAVVSAELRNELAMQEVRKESGGAYSRERIEKAEARILALNSTEYYLVAAAKRLEQLIKEHGYGH
jgi:hypothetical protein